MQNSRNVKQLSSTIDIYIQFMLELHTLLWHFPGMAQSGVELKIDEYKLIQRSHTTPMSHMN